MPKKVFICSFGEPRGHYCWGHIHSELEKRGRLAGSIDTHIYDNTIPWKILHKATMRISKLVYKKAHFDFKGSLHRRARALYTRRCLSRSEAKIALHITTLDMPDFLTDNIQHYILIDSTWNSWSKYISRDGYSDRLWRDIDTLDQESYNKSKHIFTLGSHVCDDLVQHYGIPKEKCTAIGGGLGSIQPYNGPKDYNKRNILFVAKTRFESKGGLLLLNAFKILLKKDSSVKLTIVGGVGGMNYEESIPNVTIKPYISDDELQALFNSASLFVMPALNEPWGMVYLEAMACKTPVVGIRRGALPEFTLDGTVGFLIDRPDPEVLAETLASALSDPKKLRVLGKAAQNHVFKNYSWSKAVTRMLSVIDGK